MPPRFQSFFASLGALALIAGAFFFLVRYLPQNALTAEPATTITVTQTASVNTGLEVLPPPIATSAKTVQATTVKISPKPAAQKPAVQKQSDDEAVRIADPYPFPPKSFGVVNIITREALVNILCIPGNGSLQSILGSGVIIDPRGVILTNAHMAQYVLLAESGQINLSCVIRTGAPAMSRWSASVLYIPPVWVEAHAREIKMAHPVGTGEHDYALLLITGSLDGLPLPTSFPALSIDTREAVGFTGDDVLVASYPAEFLGGLGTQSNLYPVSSITTVGQLMTFVAKTVDLLSLGGIIEAQSGSSGGAVVNAWGRLVALIATTSDGATTESRDLRAITLSYIDRDLAAQTQFDLPTILGGDVLAQAEDFNVRVAPRLVELYIDQIGK